MACIEGFIYGENPFFSGGFVSGWTPSVSWSSRKFSRIYTTVERMYSEQTFQYLLASESKRSEISGYSFNILLIYSTDKQGLIVQMDRDMADTVVTAVFRTLRETDYIGWYREGCIVGGVLTVFRQDSAVEVSARVQQRVMEILGVDVSVEKNRRLQIRTCQYHALEGIEPREGISSAT